MRSESVPLRRRKMACDKPQLKRPFAVTDFRLEATRLILRHPVCGWERSAADKSTRNIHSKRPFAENDFVDECRRRLVTARIAFAQKRRQ